MLAKIGHVHLLTALCDELIIPLAVANELSAGSSDDPGRIWMESEGSRFVARQDPLSPVVASWDLGRGEAAVLSYAVQHPGSEAIVDDQAARACAQSLGVPVRGTIGVILLAKKVGVIERASPLLDRITAAGLHISANMLEAARRLAEEP